MKILLLSNIPSPYQLDFFDTLSKKTPVLAVFINDKESNRDWVLGKKKWIKILDDLTLNSKWKSLKIILDQFKPDNILVGGYSLPLSIRIKIYSFKKNINYFYWLEQPLPSSIYIKFIKMILWSLTLPFAKGIFCIGDKALNDYKPFARHVYNLPYSINSARYFKRKKRRNYKIIKCLFIGQYIDRKGIRELLEGFSKISPNEATLTFFGSGDLKCHIQAYEEKYPHIKDLGFIDPKDLPKLLVKYDLLIAPSKHDGWGVVVVEAMMSGLPVISTKNTGAFLQLGNVKGILRNGTECKVESYSIYKSILRYIKNPDRINFEGANARQAVINSNAESSNASNFIFDTLNNNRI